MPEVGADQPMPRQDAATPVDPRPRREPRENGVSAKTDEAARAAEIVSLDSFRK